MSKPDSHTGANRRWFAASVVAKAGPGGGRRRWGARLQFLLGALLALSVSAAGAQTITEFSAGISAGAGPLSITAGPDGNLWFTENNGNRIGKITTAGVVTQYSTGISLGAYPNVITKGPDSNLWFTEDLGNRIAKITTAGVVTQYSLPTAAAGPLGITAGPDNNLWFTEGYVDNIGKITTAGAIIEYSTPYTTYGLGMITKGPDGNLWFTEPWVDTIGKMTTAGVVTEYSVSSGATPWAIVAGPDGNLWFTERGKNKIGKITPAGVVTEYTAGAAGTTTEGITLGPDNNLWYTKTDGNVIGKITTAGVVTEYSAGLSPNAGLYSITAGPDGNLWFTEYNLDRIGRLALSATVVPPTVTTGAASAISATGATLAGTVTAGGAQTTVTFQYGLTTGYGLTATATQSPLSGSATNAAVSAPVTGLTCNTPYHFRVTATNSAGPVQGSDQTFTTAACPATPPSVTTSAATAIGTAVATLNGTVSSNGASTTVTFDYGLTAGYGSSATAQQSPLAPGASGAAVSATIGSLVCNTTYHFRAVGASTGGTTNGGDLTFVTAACPTALAPGGTQIGSGANPTPMIITTLPVTCPAGGAVLVAGSGESAALSSNAGTAFIGLAYSIARDSTATDNANVVQSSALAVFNGDANRDFLNVQRIDSCTPGATNVYRLTAYPTTNDTGAGSFLWNGRLSASEPYSSPGAGFAAGVTTIASQTNATPTIVSTLSVTCPAAGAVLVGGSGESAAVSSNPSTAFIGLAYSISRDSMATDNGNVVQSSALAQFNGDANRDFLNVQRVDSCTPGLSSTYRLTAYRTTADTVATSFVWNGRLTASEPYSSPGAGFAAGSTPIGSSANATPTIVASLPVTCPSSGSVLIGGSGESTALSTNGSTAFIGLAYSIARDSTATDNGNVVQSSALAIFNGDANRDFLNVQRVDSCTPGVTSTYRLTAYRTTPDTSAASFVWNGRLTAIELP